MSAPVPVPFLWTLDFGFGTWIWDLDLGLGFGTGLGLDNYSKQLGPSSRTASVWVKHYVKHCEICDPGRVISSPDVQQSIEGSRLEQLLLKHSFIEQALKSK